MRQTTRPAIVLTAVFSALLSHSATAARFESPQVFRLETPRAQSEKKTEADYWRATGLTIRNYFDDVTEHCYESLKAFRGCYEGLSLLAGATSDGAILGTTGEKMAGHPLLGDVTESLGGELRIYQLQKATVKVALEIKTLRQKIRGIHQMATESLFKSGPRIDFQKLMSSLQTRVLTGENRDNEAYVAANLYNAYLGATDDPHSRLSPTQQELDEMQAVDEQFVGVGIQTRQKNEHLIVYSLVRGAPAEKAGLHRNDEITAVDGVPVAGLSDAQISAKIRGAAGTTVRLSVLRQGKPIEIPIVRGSVVTKNVDARIVEDAGIKVGYIKFKEFMDQQGADKVRSAIRILEANGAQALILDLRGNLGGLLAQAFSISEFFVGRKPILSVMTLATGRRQTYMGENAPITALPLAVLIDSYSASASEITAGALQDNERGWIVGERSFGKGSVQTVARFNFKSYNGDRMYGDVMDPAAPIRYRKTFQRFYQPSGRTNQIQGILPNFEVDPFPGATEADKVRFREEDYYENALPAIEHPWVESRPEQVASINGCRNRAGADAWYKSLADSDTGPDAPDYRLYTAEDILRCDLQTGASFVNQLMN